MSQVVGTNPSGNSRLSTMSSWVSSTSPCNRRLSRGPPTCDTHLSAALVFSSAFSPRLSAENAPKTARKFQSRVNSNSLSGCFEKPDSQNHSPLKNGLPSINDLLLGVFGKSPASKASAQGVSGQACAASSCWKYHMLDIPMWPVSSMVNAAPASPPTVPWPVQSANSLPRNWRSRPVRTSSAVTALMRPPGASCTTPMTKCPKNKVSVFSLRQTFSLRSSTKCAAGPGLSGERSANSSTISPMCGYLPRMVPPCAHTPISLEPLPPSTNLSCTRATRSDCRAAAMAVPNPA